DAPVLALGRRREDRVGQQPLALGVLPELVQARQAEAALGAHEERLLGRLLPTLGGLGLVPLVEAVGRHDRATLREGPAEGGLLGDGLAARVDEPAPDRRV